MRAAPPRDRTTHKTLEGVTRRGVLALSALGALAAPAWACPSCSLSQGLDTLGFILAFLVVPYVIVSGTWMWIRRILKSERS